jgi:hypothetical protein
MPAQTCSGGYLSGTVVQLTAVPNAGYIFGHWSGAVSTPASSVSITMSGNKSETASFRGIAVLTAPSGTVAGWDHKFRWTGVGNATKYQFDVRKSNGVVLLSATYTAASAACPGGGPCVLAPSTLANLGVGNYRWRVRDYGAYGYGPWTDYVNFALP